MMKWIEGWYVSYALLGVAAAGILPILLPISVEGASGASLVGLVMAAFSFGGLTAPLWGRLADKRRLHKILLAGGLGCAALASAAFPFVHGPAIRAALALLQGIGIAAVATTANLFVVEAHPQPQWDARIGWLQTFYGGGQVLGLLLAGVVATANVAAGLLLAAALLAAAVFPGLLAAPRLAPAATDRRPALTHSARHAEWPPGSPQRLYHHPGLRAFRLFGSLGGPSFILLLLGWFLSFGGSAAFFSLYPIVMKHSYGVGPALSSTGFAVAAGLGLLLYAPAGRWSTSRKPMVVLRGGLAIRAATYALLALLLVFPGPARGWLALLMFLVIVLAWSALSVASTALVAALFSREGNEGEGLGLFNAVTALAGVVGSVGGGWAAVAGGYGAIPFVALGGTLAGLLVLAAVRLKAA
jgi:DHA1 family tetracycline resistance protein-like MFS transporter